MSNLLLFLVITILLVAVLGFLCRVLDWVWFRPKRIEKKLRACGFKGNPYRILVGDIREITAMSKQAKERPVDFNVEFGHRVDPFGYHTVNNYGNNSFIWFGPTPRVIISNPELIRQVLTKMDDFPRLSSDPRSRYLGTGLITLKGEKWAKHRRLMTPAFRVEKLKLMLPAFFQSCNEMISKWEGLVPEEGSFELDVFPHLQALSSDAISRTAFGSSYLEGKRIFELLKQLAVLTVQMLSQSIYIPGSRFFPNKTMRRLQAMDKEVKDSIKGIIKKREELIRAGEPVADDLLGILMQSNYTEIQQNRNNKNVGMSYEDIVKECKLFYFAGQETTSTLLVWTMILLAKHSNWQERAREEVLQVFGNKNPDADELSQLKIVNMILNESLRLYPPITRQTRAVPEDITVGGTKLPAGVQLILSTMMVHHDHEIWGKDALQFNPERFSEGISKVTNNNVSFFPFGWGPRICIGQNFALMEAKIAIAVILQRFSFELSPSYTHAPCTVVTLQPQHGAHLILHKLERREV